jgi:hypothetical protein
MSLWYSRERELGWPDVRRSGCFAAAGARDGSRPVRPHLPDSGHCPASGDRRRRQPDPGCCVLRENHRFSWRITCFCVFLGSHVLCGPSVAVLLVDPPCGARRDALDGLTVAATLAHELCWTCVCREDPRRCAADFRRLCPFNRVGICPRL